MRNTQQGRCDRPSRIPVVEEDTEGQTDMESKGSADYRDAPEQGCGSGSGRIRCFCIDPDPDPFCPERLDPDPVCPERLDPDPVNIRPDAKPCS